MSFSVLLNNTIECKCVGKHIPKPMELQHHHVWPTKDGGPDIQSNKIFLCPTTHSNVHSLWDLYETHNGRPPWEILKNYSEYTRYVVERGRELRRSGQMSSNSISPSPYPIGYSS